MSFEQALGLVARAGLLSQLAFALVVAVLFLILRPYAGPQRRYFGSWQWAWLAMAAAVGALTLRFYLYPDAQEARFGRETAAAALHAVYQLGKFGFFALLLAGTLHYVRGSVPARTERWLMVGVLLLTGLSVALSSGLHHLVQWQSLVTVAVSGACVLLLLRSHARRALRGERLMAVALILTGVVWALYFVAFQPEPPSPLALRELVIHFNSYLDLLLQLTLGYGMVILLMEDVRDDVEQSHRLAQQAVQARERVLQIVSHDLRSPLTNIMLNVDLASSLLHKPDAAVEVQRLLGGVTASVEQMNHLIADFLDLTRSRSGQLKVVREPLHLVGVVQAMIEPFRRRAEQKGIRLLVQMQDDLPAVLGDAPRIVQVMGNFLENAIRHTPPGGQIVLDAERRGGEVRVSVSDTGEGIAREQLPLVFEPFWQGDPRRHSGTGLGLAIAKVLIEAHGGTIRVDSRVGEGSTFAFTLPALLEADPATMML